MKTPIAIVCFATLFLFACNKKEENAEKILETAQDNSTMEAEYSNMFDLTDNVSRDESVQGLVAGKAKTLTNTKAGGYIPDCATLDYDTTTSTLLIDYGNEPCLCKDGRYRKGKLFITYSGEYLQAGTKLTLSVEDYFVNDVKFNGSKSVTCLGNNEFLYEVKNASAETENGTITWETTVNIQKSAGFSTPFNPFDDVFLYTGSSNGINRRGVAYTVNITTPLKKRTEFNAACLKYFVSGVLRIEDEDENYIAFDYDPIGGEPCDVIAHVDINGDYMSNFSLE